MTGLIALVLCITALLSGLNLLEDGRSVDRADELGVSRLSVTLDRFEGDYAVLLIREEEAIRIDLPISLLPRDSREGDILIISIEKDVGGTEGSMERTSEIMERLKKRG